MGISLLFQIAVLLAGASDYEYSYDYGAGFLSTPYEIGTTSKTPLTVDELYSSINGLKNPSIEALLPELKKKDPSMFEEYILMYGSRSLQASSFMNPRALLVTKHAELVVSFNGEESQKGFNELEIMFFDKKTNRFNFQEISFRGGKVTYSQLNPAKCLSCHQSPDRLSVDPRPNWEAYNVWPGAYNSVSHISQVTDPDYTPGPTTNTDGTYNYGEPAGSLYNPFLASQLALEETEAAKFFNGPQPTHSRYQYLKPFEVFTWPGVPNYFDGGTGLKTPNNMPLRFTQSLALLNARRLGRMIQTDYPLIYERYKYAILSAVNCGTLPIPDNVKAWHNERMNKLGIPLKDFGSNSFTKRPEYALDLIFKAFGVETADWTMDFNTGGIFAMTNKYGIPGGTSEKNVAVAGGLQEVWQVPEFGDGRNCDELEKKSLEVLSAPAHDYPVYNEIEKAKRPLLNRCIECHVELQIAPFIPFNDPVALKQALVKNDSELYKKIQYRLGPFPAFRDAMPPQGYVTPGQKQEVLDYISGLYYSKDSYK